jgi:hypothetical protein
MTYAVDGVKRTGLWKNNTYIGIERRNNIFKGGESLNMKNDVIILGGGISGLYLGIELLKQNRKVLLLEKNSRLGGRIYTIKYENHTLESGAGRFSECHQMLFNLLKRYKLFDKKYPITKYADVLVSNKKNYSTNVEDYYKLIFSKSKNYKNSYLANKYTYEILEEILGSKELVKHFVSIYGYTGDVMYSNAICGLNILSCDYYSEQFYVLIGGLTQLVDKMKDEFIQLGGKIQLDMQVENIYQSSDSSYLLEAKGNKYTCNQLVLAITPKAIEKLKPRSVSFDFLKFVQPVPLLRIYFYYDKKNAALSNLKKLITDLDIHYIIPINQNSIMISYTDSKLADFWNSLYKENKDLFYKKILSEFTACTGVKLGIPDKVFMEYWSEGMYVWTPGFNYVENYDNVINPMENLFISNEGISKKQGWIEGALLVANDVLEKMKK